MNDTITSEQGVLGALIHLGDLNSDTAQKIFSYLKESSFSMIQHQKIYRAIKAISMKGIMLDMMVLDVQLQKTGEIDEVGGFAYLGDLGRASSSSANLMVHCEDVRQGAIKRMVNSKLQNAIAMLNEPSDESVYKKIGLIESEISAILERSVNGQDSGLVHANEICDRWSQEMQDRFDNPSAQSGYTTGITDLDQTLAPKMIRKGSLVVVGARPKMGKTALLGTIIKHFTLEHKKAAAVFSLEMPSDQIMERMICERADVNGSIFYEGAHDQTDFQKVSKAMGEYIGSSLYMDDTPAITLQHIQRESRKLAKKEDIGIIAVDYLTLMEAEKADRNDLAYGKITKGLKNLAKELGCVVLLLTQLNRSLESRPNKRPMPSDSRDTGQIEQDCDLWLGLYREAVYNENIHADDKGITEIIVRLNRHGNTGTAHLNLVNGYFKETHRRIEEKKKDKGY